MQKIDQKCRKVMRSAHKIQQICEYREFVNKITNANSNRHLRF